MYAPQSSPPSGPPAMYAAYYGPQYSSQQPYPPYQQQPYAYPTSSSPPTAFPPVGEDARGGYQMQSSPAFPPGVHDGERSPFSPELSAECLGGGAPGVPFDIPNFRSLVGGIISGLMAMICISLFICLARADFNLVFYLMGYYIWCIESDVTDYEGVHKLARSVHHFTVALCLACIIDIMWLFMAFSTWLCASGTAEVCFSEPEDSKLKWTYGIHSMVLFLSTINLFIKAAVIIMSFSWMQKQRKVSAPPSPSCAHPPVSAQAT
eukprot:GHVS01051923.1.p1 GENE.GHVS01051923.1~~GHVS01051923.1.p1  ORF type:complete len:264 (+),score=50.95 GHVS01051923.1:168-959(+)